MMKPSDFIGMLILTMTVVVRPNASVAMSADTELLLIDDNVLKVQVVPAIADFLDRGDPSAARRLVEEAISGKQFQAILKGDRTAAQYFVDGSRDLLDGKLPKEILDDGGETIRDPELIRRRQTEIILSPLLVLFLCAWSKNGSQTIVPLSHSQLTAYLRSKSPWMEDFLGSSNELLWHAPDLPLPIGGEAKLLTRSEASTLLNKLRQVPRPLQGETLIGQYETLKQLLEIAVQDPRFRVLIRTT